MPPENTDERQALLLPPQKPSEVTPATPSINGRETTIIQASESSSASEETQPTSTTPCAPRFFGGITRCIDTHKTASALCITTPLLTGLLALSMLIITLLERAVNDESPMIEIKYTGIGAAVIFGLSLAFWGLYACGQRYNNPDHDTPQQP